MKLRGRIVTWDDKKHLGWISNASITKQFGSFVEIGTTQDVYIHQQDSAFPLKQGMEIIFDTVPNPVHGEGCLRTKKGVEVPDKEILPPLPTEVPPAPVEPAVEVVAPQAEHALEAGPKPAEPPTPKTDKVGYGEVANNRPFAGLRDNTAISWKSFMVEVLRPMFPKLPYLGKGVAFDADRQSVEEFALTLYKQEKRIGMDSQAKWLWGQFRTFLATRKSLTEAAQFMEKHKLLYTHSVVSLRYLPDLFVAAPVWHFVAGFFEGRKCPEPWTENSEIWKGQFFSAQLMPKSFAWRNTFLMFNRNQRLVKNFKGGVSSPALLKLTEEAKGVFDRIIFMSPYLDDIGPPWQNAKGKRGTSTYVVAFKTGVPLMFILGRTGGDSLLENLTEHTANTVDFLRTHKEVLRKVDEWKNYYWFATDTGGAYQYTGYKEMGTWLVGRCDDLLLQFEAGKLYDCLRGDYSPEVV